ncbi:MAG: hypothetical protein JXR05_00975 [Flavobacteriaceae bacterium]
MANPTPTPDPKEVPTPKKTPVAPAPKAKVLPGFSQDVIDDLTEEVNDMISFAAHNGLEIDTNVNTLIANNTVDDLINAHNLMSKSVAPATPKSIDYTREVKRSGKGKSIFNKIPLVRNLVVLAIIFLVLYIGFGLFPQVNNQSIDKGILGTSSLDNVWELFLNLGFLASISGLGVLFHLLKKISTSVENSTLVPEESVNYISQVLLGIIAGLLLSEILSSYIHSSAEDVNLMNKSLLALVGGFSSDTIFSLLQGLITRIKSIFIPTNGN